MEKYDELQQVARKNGGVPLDAASQLGAWAKEVGVRERRRGEEIRPRKQEVG